jgi:hypothetical protein
MNEDAFWRHIDLVWEQVGPVTEEYGEALSGVLEPLHPEELISFERIFDDLMNRAYMWNLWGAAYVVNGGCSDDGFVYFRAWLIMQGREIYEKALANPDSLAELCGDTEEDYECEDVLYVARQLYEDKTGTEMAYAGAIDANTAGPAGERWEEGDLAGRLPELTRIHWTE